MLKVLFGRSFREENCSEKELKAIEALEAASYLAVDQYNGNGTKELRLLLDYRVPSIPSDISAIDFLGNQHHRRYTHRGWLGPNDNESMPYPDDRAHWNTRRMILMQTVKKVFDLNDSQKQLQDSIAAVIYYIHILGDHIAETDYQKMNQNLIGVGGRNDSFDILHQLIIHFDVLFTSPTVASRYSNLRAQLRLMNSDFSTLINRDGGVNTQEKQRQYRTMAEKLMNILINQVPPLLQEEEWFKKVFPSD
ncbi:MAG: hypothetical protein IKS31_03155 [Clostridia bacterium]|nr:hypothetical protein [Clostridia bacterium]